MSFSFYNIYENDYKEFTITDSDLDNISKLSSKIIKSTYYDYCLSWSLEDNKHILSSKEDLDRLHAAMQFITMTAIVSSDVIKSLNLKSYHIGLLRALYLDNDGDRITMGYKRPFGKSYVLGDVSEAISLNNDRISPLYDNNHREERIVLREFVEFLDRFFKESLFELKYKAFESHPGKPSEGINGINITSRLPSGLNQVYILPEIRNDQTWEYLSKDDNGNKYHLHHYLRYWGAHKKEIRDIKINDILSK
jgi:hypothetical protein